MIDEKQRIERAALPIEHRRSIVHLRQRHRIQLTRQRHIPGVLPIVVQAQSEAQRIVQKEPLVHIRRALRENAGRDGAEHRRMLGEQAQTPPHRHRIAERSIVDQRLQPQIADPQPPVALRPVLEHLLRTLRQRPQAHLVDAPQQRIGHVQRPRLCQIEGGHGIRPHPLQQDGKAQRIGAFDLDVPEGVAPFQRPLARQKDI